MWKKEEKKQNKQKHIAQRINGWKPIWFGATRKVMIIKIIASWEHNAYKKQTENQLKLECTAHGKHHKSFFFPSSLERLKDIWCVYEQKLRLLLCREPRSFYCSAPFFHLVRVVISNNAEIVITHQTRFGVIETTLPFVHCASICVRQEMANHFFRKIIFSTFLRELFFVSEKKLILFFTWMISFFSFEK